MNKVFLGKATFTKALPATRRRVHLVIVAALKVRAVWDFLKIMWHYIPAKCKKYCNSGLREWHTD